MIETYLCARDRFLKPGGKMFPNVGNLCIAPFSDAVLHWEQQNKNGFWKNTSFYGVNLTAVLPRCSKEYFRQPVVDYINPECLVAECHTTRFDFTTVTLESLQHIEIPFEFVINQPCLVHGMAGWFDALFEGTNSRVVLSTAPWNPGTHWYQIRFLIETPLAVNAGQCIEGVLKMDANDLQSYYVSLTMKIRGTDVVSEAPSIDLKDPEYRFYTSAHSYCPPGTPGLWGQHSAQQANTGAVAATAAAAALAQNCQQAMAHSQATATAQTQAAVQTAQGQAQQWGMCQYGQTQAAGGQGTNQNNRNWSGAAQAWYTQAPATTTQAQAGYAMPYAHMMATNSAYSQPRGLVGQAANGYGLHAVPPQCTPDMVDAQAKGVNLGYSGQSGGRNRKKGKTPQNSL